MRETLGIIWTQQSAWTEFFRMLIWSAEQNARSQLQTILLYESK